MCVLSDLLCVPVNSLLLEGEFFLQLVDEGLFVLHLIFLHLQLFFKRNLQDSVGILELEGINTHTHTHLIAVTVKLIKGEDFGANLLWLTCSSWCNSWICLFL